VHRAACHPLTIEIQFTGSGGNRARQQADERTLAGPVRTNHTQQVAWRDADVDAGHRPDPAKRARKAGAQKKLAVH